MRLTSHFYHNTASRRLRVIVEHSLVLTVWTGSLPSGVQGSKSELRRRLSPRSRLSTCSPCVGSCVKIIWTHTVLCAGGEELSCFQRPTGDPNALPKGSGPYRQCLCPRLNDLKDTQMGLTWITRTAPKCHHKCSCKRSKGTFERNRGGNMTTCRD